MPMMVRVSILLAALLLLLAGCGSEPEEPAILGEAYVGPFELEILKELSPESPIAARLAHGEKVEITARRRRFACIRTETGVEGWTDGQMLLTVSQMARLRHLSMNAGRIPSQGKATVYDVLNIHTAPNRQAPSFYQMVEGVLAEVVAHQLVERATFVPLEDDDPGAWPVNSYAAPGEEPAGSSDEWTLVRLPNGRSGWALSRLLVMAIPDEVAQYAEGQRITSYFSLGRVQDNGEWKHHWLWTTKRSRGAPYQFDSFRVFVWSLRRHRYETAYIARNVIGYYPTQAVPMTTGENGAPDTGRICAAPARRRRQSVEEDVYLSGVPREPDGNAAMATTPAGHPRNTENLSRERRTGRRFPLLTAEKEAKRFLGRTNWRRMIPPQPSDGPVQCRRGSRNPAFTQQSGLSEPRIPFCAPCRRCRSGERRRMAAGFWRLARYGSTR